MQKYYEILWKEYNKCLQHNEKYNLNTYNYLCSDLYNPMEDAKCCAYYYIKETLFNNKKLITFAKNQL